jgi:hypothetical protein
MHTRARRVETWAWAALTLAFIVGCNLGPRAPVTGKVTYDGQQVDAGGIAFLPMAEGSDGVRATGLIQNGRYALDGASGPMPGKYRVEIFWHKKTGNKVRGEGGRPKDEVVEGLPAKYNAESELTVEVQAGRNTFDFDLKK